MRSKTFIGNDLLHAGVGMAIMCFFALTAGISRMEAQTKSGAQQSLDKSFNP
jgi:hypothetical protein